MQFYPISQSGRFDIDPIPLLKLEVGDAVSLDLNTFLTRGAPSVVWSVNGGALPAGLSLSAEGILAGEVLAGGAFVVQVKADAGALGLATQGVAFLIPVEDGPAVDPTVWARGTGGQVVDYTDAAGTAWRTHIFLGANNFVGTDAGAAEALVVGGGGGSGNGGGGGAGGVAAGGPVRVMLGVKTYPVVVGAGGAPGTGKFGNRYGRKGSDSSFAGIVGLGGGGGIGSNDTVRGTPDGGCGGGDGASVNATPYAPGTGFFGQGHAGGLGNEAGASTTGNGGGGGAGEAGKVYNDANRPGGGGDGIQSDISGVLKYYAGGGAGGFVGATYFPTGGQGGGGNYGQAGQINTGGGAGGGLLAGGSGIVIVRYKL